MNTLFAFLAAGVLGFGIVRTQGRFFLGGFQASLAKGEIPAKQALHSALIFFGGLGLIVPGFLSDAVGLLFVLPGSRHAIASYLKYVLAKKVGSGAFRVFTMGNMPPFGSSAPGPQPGPRPGEWRDVSPRALDSFSGGDVIDVEPVNTSSRSSNHSSEDDSN